LGVVGGEDKKVGDVRVIKQSGCVKGIANSKCSVKRRAKISPTYTAVSHIHSFLALFLTQFISISLSYEHTHSLSCARAVSLYKPSTFSLSLSVSCCIQRTQHTLSAVTSFIRFFCFRTGFHTNQPQRHWSSVQGLSVFTSNSTYRFLKTHTEDFSRPFVNIALSSNVITVIIFSAIFFSWFRKGVSIQNTALKTLEATTDCYCFSALA